MENMLLFQIDKLKYCKIIKTYNIYTNGDINGFDSTDGSRYSISHQFPYYFRKAGISISAVFQIWLCVTPHHLQAVLTRHDLAGRTERQIVF